MTRARCLPINSDTRHDYGREIVTAFARFRQADVTRAMKAAKSAGYENVRVIIAVDGTMDIIVGKAANDQKPPVELD